MEKVGPYQLIGRLATGGMAEVFLARREGPGGFEKLAVVKRILPQFAEDPEFRRMFLDEARLAARINHPNVVQIFELSEARDALYIAMEYVAGFDLARVMDASLKQRRLVPAEVAARIVADACAGLDAAHRLTDAQGRKAGVVHRDISPENLLVSEVGQTKVVDFGIARAGEGSSHTQSSSGRLKGKVHYHAPEHIQDRPLDGRADVYALGVVLYELICARRPFEGLSETEVMRACVERDAPPPTKYYPTAEPTLARLALEALVRDPTERPTAGALRDELEVWLRTHPCSATDVERFLLEVIPADSPDRQKVPKLLAAAPAAGSGDPGRGSTRPLGKLSRARAKSTRQTARWAVPVLLVAAAGAGFVLWPRPPAAEVQRPADPPHPPQPVVHEDGMVEMPLPAADAGPVRPVDPPRTAEHPRPPRKHGTTLSLITVPASEVLIDNRQAGGTPLRDYELSPGKHRLHFINHRLGLDVRREVTVASGEQAVQRFEFREVPVVISVHPFAKVLVDGNDKGNCPPQLTVSLLEGEHKVELHCGGNRVRSEIVTVPLKRPGVVKLQCAKR